MYPWGEKAYYMADTPIKCDSLKRMSDTFASISGYFHRLSQKADQRWLDLYIEGKAGSEKAYKLSGDRHVYNMNMDRYQSMAFDMSQKYLDCIKGKPFKAPKISPFMKLFLCYFGFKPD
jgi:hypothetical protein